MNSFLDSKPDPKAIFQIRSPLFILEFASRFANSYQTLLLEVFPNRSKVFFDASMLLNELQVLLYLVRHFLACCQYANMVESKLVIRDLRLVFLLLKEHIGEEQLILNQSFFFFGGTKLIIHSSINFSKILFTMF